MIAEKTTSDRFKAAAILLLWLGCSMLSAFLVSFASREGIIAVGLGWSRRPGFLILFLLLVQVTFSLAFRPRKEVLPYHLVAILLMALAMLTEFLPFPGITNSLLGVALALAGQTISVGGFCLLRSLGFWVLGVYIEAVFIYNTVTPGQVMYFFRHGATT